SVSENRTVGDEIQNDVEPRPTSCEGFALIVDDVVGPELSHVIEFALVVHTRDMCALVFGELDGKHPRSAAGPVDQNPISAVHTRCAWPGNRARLGDRRGFSER